MIEYIHILNQSLHTRLYRSYTDLSEIIIDKDFLLKCMANDISYTENNIIVHQRFAGISIIIIASKDENEFYIIELIKKYVLILNRYFNRVCELHLKLHPKECYLLLDHFILGGFCVEIDEKVVVERVREIYDLKV